MSANVSEHRAQTSELGGSRESQFDLDSLRKELDAIAETVRTVAEHRAKQLKEQADAGVHALRQQVRQHPTAAIGIATTAGALLAIALVPRRAPPKRSWSASLPVTRADFEDFSDSLQRSVARAVRTAGPPVASSLNRVVDAITNVDPKASLTPLVEKAMTWVDKTRAAAKSVNVPGTSSAR